MHDRLIYLDHAATTALEPSVLEAMLPYLTERYGNPSSIHRLGRQALDALDEARDSIAELLHVSPKELVFTGSGTEANNLAIKGVAQAQRQAGRTHLITSAIEHHAALHCFTYLEAFGFTTTVLPVDSTGRVSPVDLRGALRPDTALVSIMTANNEVGTLQPLTELGLICREHGVPFHTDAVQAAGSLELNLRELPVDLLTISAHKFYGPKGVGTLYIRRGTPLLPQISGGGQERRRRAGTENVASIVGMAHAFRLAEQQRPGYAAHCRALRDQLIKGILACVPGAHLNGHPTERLPNNASITFDGIEGESMLLLLDQQGIAASSGSACTSGSLEPSHVLLAMGMPDDQALGAVRFTIGKATTASDIEAVVAVVPQVVGQLRDVGVAAR